MLGKVRIGHEQAKATLDRLDGAKLLSLQILDSRFQMQGREHWLPHIKVKAVDATGAGDVFAGTLATSLARNRPFGEA
jgi:sugar/nucleoside kinase (ribokinase family)